MQQLESYTHRQESRHGLRFPGRTTKDGGETHVRASWLQFEHASSLKKGTVFISFHRLVVDSSTAFTNDLPLPFSTHSSTSSHTKYKKIYINKLTQKKYLTKLAFWFARQVQVLIKPSLLWFSGLVSRWNPKTGLQLERLSSVSNICWTKPAVGLVGQGVP